MISRTGLLGLEQQALDTPEGVIEYYALGSGPPLVLLHGLGGSADVWYRVAPSLGERFTVYTPQVWGSERPAKRRYTVDDGVAFVTAFMDGVRCGPAHLCGSSLGGLMAAATAVREPDRVRSLTLAASAGLGRKAALFLRFMTLPVVGELLFRPSRRRVRRLLNMLIKDKSQIEEELLDAVYQHRLEPGIPRQMLQVLRSGIGPLGAKASVLLTQDLQSIGAPTLLLWGERDPLFPLEQARGATDAIPGARLHVFPGAGHWPYVEQPDEFVRVLMAFLSGCDGID